MTNSMPMDRMANPTKSSENRRATKPIMEKRRRARINQCLGELKTLILDALNKDPSRHSKLEKADILEMTVRHLQNIQRQQMAAAISTDPSVLNKFRAGFSECAGEVSRYVGRIEGVEPGLRQRLLNHLAHCLNTLNAATAPFSGAVAFPGMNPPLLSHLQALNVQIPGNVSNYHPTQGIGGGDINNNNTTPSTPATRGSSNSSSTPPSKFLGGLPLIPSRLPNGDLALLLPSHALPSGQIPQNLFGLPVVMSPDGKEGQFNWGPPTPTSPSVSRRSSSPTSSVTSALSPTGSDSSDVEDMEHSNVQDMRSLDDNVFREPAGNPPQRNCSLVRDEPVWRPW